MPNINLQWYRTIIGRSGHLHHPIAPIIHGIAFPGPSWGRGAGTCRDGSSKATIAVERAPENGLEEMKLDQMSRRSNTKSLLVLLLSSVYGKVLYYLIYLLLSCYWLLLLSKYNHSELSYISVAVESPTSPNSYWKMCTVYLVIELRIDYSS